MEEESQQTISSKDKQALFEGCFYPEYNTIFEQVLKPLLEANKEFGKPEEAERLQKVVDLFEGKDKMFTQFESMYMPHFESMSKTDQKAIIAAAKQRIAVAKVADQVYEDFLDMYVPEEKSPNMVN